MKTEYCAAHLFHRGHKAMRPCNQLISKSKGIFYLVTLSVVVHGVFSQEVTTLGKWPKFNLSNVLSPTLTYNNIFN